MNTSIQNNSGAPLPTQPGAVGELTEIPLADLHESPWNPRQYYPDQAMLELTQSIRQSGFRPWLPLMVRPRAEGGFEIGAGHRRSRAACDAGIESVPCIVRSMTDVEFLDVLNFDNSGREDVHPLHEASGWAAWMEKTGKGVLDIAARIGQSKEYVYQRLKYSALSEAGRKAFLDGEITAGHAILIARLQPNDQKKALKYCEPPAGDKSRKQSVRDLAVFIQRDIHLDMTRASFDLSDENLVAGAGSCAACPKRTKNSPDLIPILVPTDDGDCIDECTDPACFHAKLGTHLIRIKQALAEQGTPAIDVSSGYAKAKNGVLSANDYQRSAKGAADAKPAVITDGSNAGQIIYIKVRSKSAESAAGAPANGEKEERLSEEKNHRELTVRLKILEAVRAKTGGRLLKWEVGALVEMVLKNMDISGPVAAALCRFRGIPFPAPKDRWDDPAVEALIKALPSLSDVEMFRLAIELPITDELDEHALFRPDPPKKLLDLARSHNVDAVKIRRDTEEALKAAEGGTRREVEKPKPSAVAKKPAARKASSSATKKTVAAKPVATKKAAKPVATKKAAKLPGKKKTAKR